MFNYFEEINSSLHNSESKRDVLHFLTPWHYGSWDLGYLWWTEQKSKSKGPFKQVVLFWLVQKHNAVFWLFRKHTVNTISQCFGFDCCSIFPRHELCGNRACTVLMGTTEFACSHESLLMTMTALSFSFNCPFFVFLAPCLFFSYLVLLCVLSGSDVTPNDDGSWFYLHNSDDKEIQRGYKDSSCNHSWRARDF